MFRISGDVQARCLPAEQSNQRSLAVSGVWDTFWLEGATQARKRAVGIYRRRKGTLPSLAHKTA